MYICQVHPHPHSPPHHSTDFPLRYFPLLPWFHHLLPNYHLQEALVIPFLKNQQLYRKQIPNPQVLTNFLRNLYPLRACELPALCHWVYSNFYFLNLLYLAWFLLELCLNLPNLRLSFPNHPHLWFYLVLAFFYRQIHL